MALFVEGKKVGNTEQVRHGRHVRVNVPFLERFHREGLYVTGCKEDFLSNDDCFRHYVKCVNVWTAGDLDRKGQTAIITRKWSFFRQFKVKLIAAYSRKVTVDQRRGNGRGYRGLVVKRLKRNNSKGEALIEISVSQVDEFQKMVKNEGLKYEVRDVANFGKCVFSTKDIRKGEIVSEYIGETITQEECLEREEFYQSMGLPPAMFELKRNNTTKIIDPWRYEAIGYKAHYINHDLRYANIKPVEFTGGGAARIFFIALHDIPATIQLLYNYNDTSCYFYHANTFGAN